MDELNQQLVSVLRKMDGAVNIEPSEILIGDVELPFKKIDLPAHLCQFKPVMYCQGPARIPTVLKPVLRVERFPDKHFFLILTRRTASYLERVKQTSDPGHEVKDFLVPICALAVWEKAQHIQLEQAGSEADDIRLTPGEISVSLQGILDLSPDMIEKEMDAHVVDVLQRGGVLMADAAKGDLTTVMSLARLSAEAEVLIVLVPWCGTEDNVFRFLRRCREKLMEKVS